LNNPLQNKRKLTLTAVFAALYTVGSFLPGFPVIGSSGSTIPLVRGFEMMYGIILGPFFGPLAAFMGSFIGRFLTGGSLLLSPLAPVSAFMAATIGRKDLGEKGWRIGAGVFSFLILIYYFTETGRQAYYYPVLHVLSLLMLIIFGDRISGFRERSERKSVSIVIALISLP
jgi:predicted membrane protein